MTTQDQLDRQREKKRARLRTAIVGVSLVTALVFFEFRDSFGPHGSTDNNHSVALLEGPSIEPVKSLFAQHRIAEPTYPLPGFIAKQLPEGAYQTVRTQLIRNTVAAVQDDDRLAVAHSLALLGAAALAENDLASARVYLDEALDVYEQENDELGIGSVELLRSRVESVARENARDASSAHDVMQIAAWMIVKQRFYEAEESIQSAIDENRRLNRYGAAAAGYEMLERGYRSMGDTSAANEAAIKALRLHAESGRSEKAGYILARLEASGLALQDREQLKQDINRASTDYNASVHEMKRAQDYEHLYRRMVAAGDPVQAWLFREKANRSMALASKRAMHRRQTGVIALLYTSNQNRRAARQSLDRARTIFTQQSRDDVLEHIDRAQNQIW